MNEMESPMNELTQTIIASYQAYLNNPEERDVRYIRTLYRNDGLWVENPPIEQNYQVAFYKKITHTWVIHNMGKVTWKDRCLKCMDEEDVSIRPSKRVIPIQTVEPNKIVKLSVDFDSRGKENKAISVWKMMDANNQDCFPGDTNVLNVVIDVVNTHSWRYKVDDNTVEKWSSMKEIQSPEWMWIQIDDLLIHLSHVRHVWLNDGDGPVRIYFDACESGGEYIWLSDESAKRFRNWWATQALFEVVKL